MSENALVQFGEEDVSLSDIAGIDMDNVEEVDYGFETMQKISANWRVKEAKLDAFDEKPVIKVTCEVINCFAVLSATETRKPEEFIGKVHDEIFNLNKDPIAGLGRAKKFMHDAGFQGNGTLQSLLDGFAGTTFDANIKHTKSKKNPDAVYANFDKVHAATAAAA